MAGGEQVMMKKKVKPLTKENLEQFCINTNSLKYNPSVAVALAIEFGLNFEKIRAGWRSK
jgi:hypothetical protein